MSVGSVPGYLRRDGMLAYRSSLYLANSTDESVQGAPTYMKVGISNNPFERMMAVHWGCPSGIQKFVFIPVLYKQLAAQVESEILKKLKPWRTRGEWVRLPVDVAEREHILELIMATAREKLTRIEPKEIDVQGEVDKYMKLSRCKTEQERRDMRKQLSNWRA